MKIIDLNEKRQTGQQRAFMKHLDITAAAYQQEEKEYNLDMLLYCYEHCDSKKGQALIAGEAEKLEYYAKLEELLAFDIAQFMLRNRPPAKQYDELMIGE